jgi:hypothetical protein
MGQKVRRGLWNGARNTPVPALKGGVGSKKIVFYTFEATNLLKTKEGECETKLKTKLKLT